VIHWSLADLLFNLVIIHGSEERLFENVNRKLLILLFIVNCGHNSAAQVVQLLEERIDLWNFIGVIFFTRLFPTEDLL